MGNTSNISNISDIANTSLSREERLAARLRENLFRRKAQARTQAGNMPTPAQDGPLALPKPGLKS